MKTCLIVSSIKFQQSIDQFHMWFAPILKKYRKFASCSPKKLTANLPNLTLQNHTLEGNMEKIEGNTRSLIERKLFMKCTIAKASKQCNIFRRATEDSDYAISY